MPGITLQMGGTTVASLDGLIGVMQQHLERFEARRDNRAAFLRVYTRMTESVRDQVRAGTFFLDAAWIERVAVQFGWWYFDAMERYDSGAAPPPAWRYAFDIAVRKQGFLLQDILLGMNAHINNDLPLVVATILRDEGDEADRALMLRRRFDHDQINRVLDMIIPAVEAETARHYGRLVRPLGLLMGTLDHALATYGLKTWRNTVWRNATFLLGARTDDERQRVMHFIQTDALDVAKAMGRFPPLGWCRPLAPVMRRLRLC